MKYTGFCSLLIFICFSATFLRADDSEAKIYRLEWDHWLWIERIGRGNPKFTPKDFDPADRTIRMFEIQSAKSAYEACGIKLRQGESFIYGPTTAVMIAKLGAGNVERVRKIHLTIAEWKAGRTEQWYLDWMSHPATKTKNRSTAKKAE